MTPTETAAILRQFNEWRRDFDDKIAQPDSFEIGEAIDAAVEMIDRLEAAEKERDDVAQQLVQSEQGKRKISEECDALRAKVAETEEQEPVALVESWANGSYSRNYKLRWLRDVNEGARLYALPGAKGEEK